MSSTNEDPNSLMDVKEEPTADEQQRSSAESQAVATTATVVTMNDVINVQNFDSSDVNSVFQNVGFNWQEAELELLQSTMPQLMDVPSFASNPSWNNLGFPSELEVARENPGEPCSNSDFPDITFKVNCHSENNKNGKYLWSTIKQKLYAEVDTGIAFLFHVQPYLPGVIVRAYTISRTEGVEEPVMRCDEHSQETDPSNKGIHYPLHFLRCSAAGSVYEMNGHLSVCTPVPDYSNGKVPVIYRFMCRTSEVNKSFITVRFDLELEGQRLATDYMDVRICACPGRDKKNEENNGGTLMPSKKKLKTEHVKREVRVYQLQGEGPVSSARKLAALISSVNS